ncbi:MAG: hypothetical protein J5767_00100 [Paludibacteraceae bacterium]|nr:hypothetical protein [Paludibacteraceae bacterium]
MMARGKNKIAMLVACTLLVGCASSPNATDVSGSRETVGDTDSSSVIPFSINGLQNDEDTVSEGLSDAIILVPQSVIDSISAIDDNAKKKLSDLLGFEGDSLSEINNYLNEFVSLIKNPPREIPKDNDRIKFAKVDNGDRIYYFTFSMDSWMHTNKLYGYFIYEKRDNSYVLLTANPTVVFQPYGVNGVEVSFVKLKDGGILLETTGGGGDETVCGYMCIEYYTIEGDCLFFGDTYSGCDGYDEVDEDGKRTFSNGYATWHTYTLDSIHYTDGYPDIIENYKHSEWYGDSDSIISESKKTIYYNFSKTEKRYVEKEI